MLRTRVIPTLLVREGCLVKTVRFGPFSYVGDPCNTVRIFNELEVDELLVLDISKDRAFRGPDFQLLADLANECFMPLGYGGGVKSLEQAKAIFDIGLEKIVINTHIQEDPSFISELAAHFGSQAVIASIDVRKSLLGGYTVFTNSGKKNTHRQPNAWARELESAGAGEILLTSIPQEGTWNGFDLTLIKSVSDEVNIPVIAHGGAGSIEDIRQAVKQANASAVALGSMVVFQKKYMGVLVNFPDQHKFSEVLS